MRYSFMLILAFSANLLYGQTREGDSLALVAIYQQCGGENWTNHDGWLDGPIDTWHGVVMSDGRVTDIELYSNNLTGVLPDEIGNLDAMEELELSSNELTGPIPASIGNCTALRRLDIHVNMFTSFPVTLSECLNLNVVIAYKNLIAGTFPGVFLDMPWLTRLELSTNALTGTVPPEINQLKNLRTLDLARNDFSGPMPRIDSLSMVSGLFLRENAFTGDLDTILGYHPELYYTLLGTNQFTGCLSESHFNPGQIQYLHFDNNNLDCIGNFSAFLDTGVIERFHCQGNKIAFEFLEPLASLGNYNYAPQDSLLTPESMILEPGASVALYAGTGGDSTVYQWYRDGTLLAGETGDSLLINNFDASNNGLYYCMATNPLLPDLTLYRHAVRLTQDGTSSTFTAEIEHPRISPNPSAGVLTVTGLSERFANAKVHIVNSTGASIAIAREEANTYDISALPAGVYVLLFQSPEGALASAKFVRL